MIALLVLISLLASTAHPNDDHLSATYVSSQGIKDAETAVNAVEVATNSIFGKYAPATYLYYNVKARYRLKSIQQDVLWLQIPCETRSKLRDLWEQTIKNKTKEILELTRYRKKDKVDCDNKTTITLPSHECLCNTSSSFRYCQVLEARDYTAEIAEKIETEMGVKIPCADELWSEVTALNNNKSFDLQLSNGSQIEQMAKDYADFTTNKYDLSYDIQSKYNQNPSSIENYCFYTPQFHRILQKLRLVEIRFRLYDDLLRMKFLSMVPFNFCTRDYLLSNCICDVSSSAAFCTGFFYKQAVLVLVNETICDGLAGHSSLTSTAPTSFYYSIIVILLLSTLRF